MTRIEHPTPSAEAAVGWLDAGERSYPVGRGGGRDAEGDLGRADLHGDAAKYGLALGSAAGGLLGVAENGSPLLGGNDGTGALVRRPSAMVAQVRPSSSKSRM
ncbi:MAG TPA: hypothetical protein VN641_17965 [Urbifossiella sp.]|nr:hypothetical protein [Urbifossiella sp.]